VGTVGRSAKIEEAIGAGPMKKLALRTPDLSERNYNALAKLFPNAVTEAVDETGKLVRAIDADVLRQEINTHVVSGKEERYQFTWPDKKKYIMLANAPVDATLRPCREESVDFDNTRNLYIEGENLDVLKLLRETYLNRVKMIYIDPPYNTGNDFIYEDDFSEDASDFLARDHQYDEDGNRMVRNLDSNGRFHTDWLNMIYPRLRVARDLLTDDGVIFISIDDNEIAQLRKICDELFGTDNFIDCLVWKKRYGGGAKEKYLVTLHEYVLFYAKNINAINEIFVPLSEESIDTYYNKKDSKYEIRGGYRTHPLEAGKAMDKRENLIYPIPTPSGEEIYPKKQWLWGKERTMEAIRNDEIEFTRGKSGAWVVSTKQYLKDENGEIRLGKMFSIIDEIYTQHGTNEMISILGDAKIFNYPKPTNFVVKLLNIGSADDSIILDFFSGSATTAHAVMQLNAEDGGKRKFIMVQLPEICDEDTEAAKAGYKNICEIGKERIRRAGGKIKADSPMTTKDLDTGFRVLKLASSNMKDVRNTPAEYINPKLDFDGLIDNIKSDRTPEDLLFQVMLDLGLSLSSPIEQLEIGNAAVFAVAGDRLLACFERVTEEIVIEIAKRQPHYAVFRDQSFANDSTLVNFEQVFLAHSPTTIRRVL
jgi:adenine-specific DNA-methyltransferase